jgi:hypothetical protein
MIHEPCISYIDLSDAIESLRGQASVLGPEPVLNSSECLALPNYKTVQGTRGLLLRPNHKEPI